MNFSQIPFLAVFALPIFSKKRPHIIVIIVDDLGERINSKQRSKLKYTIETDKAKDKAYRQHIPGWADVPWNNPDSVATRIGNYAKYDFLDLGIPIVNQLLLMPALLPSMCWLLYLVMLAIMIVLQTRSDLGEALRPPKMLSFKGFASDWTICLDHGQVSTLF